MRRSCKHTYEKGSIKTGTHGMCIFKDEDTEFQYALDFLKEGTDRNKIVIFITDHFTRDEIVEIMTNKWKMDVRKLLASLDIIIKDPSEFYFPDGKFDSIKLMEFFENVTRYAIEKGKTGVQVFGNSRKAIEKYMVNELVYYERHFEKQFEIPLTAICPYRKKDIEGLTKEQFDILKEHHLFIKEF